MSRLVGLRAAGRKPIQVGERWTTSVVAGGAAVLSLMIARRVVGTGRTGQLACPKFGGRAQSVRTAGPRSLVAGAFCLVEPVGLRSRSASWGESVMAGVRAERGIVIRLRS